MSRGCHATLARARARRFTRPLVTSLCTTQTELKALPCVQPSAATFRKTLPLRTNEIRTPFPTRKRRLLWNSRNRLERNFFFLRERVRGGPPFLSTCASNERVCSILYFGLGRRFAPAPLIAQLGRAIRCEALLSPPLRRNGNLPFPGENRGVAHGVR